MHFLRTGLLLCICLGLTVAARAKSDEKLQAEITATIIKLADRAPDNFPGIKAGEVAYRDGDKFVAVAPAQSALHANVYFISEFTATKRRFYGAHYQGADAVRRVTAAVRALPAVGGAAWTLGGGPTSDPAKWQIDIRRNGPVIANLTVSPADNSALLSIGVFATPVTDTAEITRQVDELITAAKRDFDDTPRASDRGLNGTKLVPGLLHSNESTLVTSEQYYPQFFAKWYDASAGSNIIRETLLAHLDELVASGQARKLIDKTDADMGRQLYVVIGTVGVEVANNHDDNRSGVRLRIGTLAEKPSWAAWVEAHKWREPSQTQEVYHPYVSNASSAPATHEHLCVRCNGTGKIDTADTYGHYNHVNCPICGGSGRVSN